jgi:protein O-mannosyl-transferase
VWPALWLLLDVWPLCRAEALAARVGRGRAAARLAVEKLPFVALAAGAAVLTVLAQARGGAMRTLEEVGLGERLANAAVACAAYLGKIAWPARLAFFYPRVAPGWWQVAGSVALLAAVTAVALVLRRARPWLVVGWLWFVVALVPVIGLVQVGQQAMADRYAYLPAIGVYLAAAMSAQEWAVTPARRRGLALTAAFSVAALVLLTRAQVATWKNGITLAAHALEVAGPSPVTLRTLAAARLGEGDVTGAVAAIDAAAELTPCAADLHVQRAQVLSSRGRGAEAVAGLERARGRCDDPELSLALADLLARGGERERGLAVLREALAHLPASDPRVPGLREVIARQEAMTRP